MGNSGSKKEEGQKFETSHPSLKDSNIISENGRQLIQSRFKVQSNEYEEWKHKVQGNHRPSSNYLLLPQRSQFKNDTGLCGNTGTLTCHFPYYPYLLSQLIRQRQESEHQLFKESELWYVLYSLAAAKQDIKHHTNKLGDIKPQNVFVNDDGKIKLANIYSYPREPPSFIKAIEGLSNYHSFLAPEDFTLLQNNHIENDSNLQSEVFAIGATLLATGNLSNLSSVYDYKHKQFNSQAFNEEKRKWGQNDRYSGIFRSIILNLVSNEPSNRLTDDQLWNFILPFENSILDKKQFVIPSAPYKIEQTYQAMQSRQY